MRGEVEGDEEVEGEEEEDEEEGETKGTDGEHGVGGVEKKCHN